MKKRITLSFLILLLIFILLNSNYLINNITNYTNLFIKNLFFYTLIIYTISSLLVDYDLLEMLNPITYITIMSLISGFPSGSKYTKELLDKKYINEDVANYLITYTHYPNPLFIIGSVSSIISIKYAIYLLISIYLASFITSRIFKVKFNNKRICTNKIYNLSNSLSSATINAFKTIILIYGTSIFSVIIGLLITKVFCIRGILYSITFGIFDLTKGIFSTAILHNKRISTILILLFINLSSISIHLQVKSIVSNSSIKYKNYFKGRIVSSFIALIILLIIFQSL